VQLLSWRVPAVAIGPAVGLLGALVGVYALMGRTWDVEMPAEREPLTRDELSYLNTSAVKREVRGILTGR
jgi:hypothetical protein